MQSTGPCTAARRQDGSRADRFSVIRSLSLAFGLVGYPATTLRGPLSCRASQGWLAEKQRGRASGWLQRGEAVLGFGRGGEDGARICLEGLEPGSQVGGVIGPGFAGELETTAGEVSAELSHEFLQHGSKSCSETTSSRSEANLANCGSAVPSEQFRFRQAGACFRAPPRHGGNETFRSGERATTFAAPNHAFRPRGLCSSGL